MPDQTPATTPSPVDANARLDSLRTVGGNAWRKEAEAYVGAGGALRPMDRQLLDSLQRTTRAGPPIRGVDVEAEADRLIRNGHDPEMVRQAIGDANYQPDTRTPAQREHDRLHFGDVGPRKDPAQYRVMMPPGDTPAEFNPASQALRQMMADIGMEPNAGSKLATMITDAAAQLAQSSNRDAITAEWQRRLEAAFPGDKLADAQKTVDQLLELAGGQKNQLIATSTRNSVFKNPQVFSWLLARSRSIALWKSTRPS
jgi:hypothetical protein